MTDFALFRRVQRTSAWRWRAAAPMALALLSSACEDGATIVTTGEPATDADDGSGTTPEAADTPLYALGVRVEAADSRAGYILTVPSLDAGQRWSLDSAIEV